MANCLHSLFQEIAKTTNEQELRLAVMDTVGEHFGVQSWGLYLLGDNLGEDVGVEPIPDVCLQGNPVGRYVFERHAPAHEQLVLSPGDWQQFCTRDDHAHVMSGPIISDGRLVGMLNFTRSDTKAFDTHDLADLSALCLHLSAKLAIIRATSTKSKSKSKSKLVLTNSLTAREQQIAELVAKGLTNAEIGKQLWITQNSVKQALKRMFRKLGVSARTEMVAKVFSEV